MNAYRHNIEAAHQSTHGWLFRNPDYCNWYRRIALDEHDGLLWIKGKPGAGKSTLMKQALQRTEEDASNSENVILRFFFNARGSLLERSPLGLFRSLLHQVLSQVRSLLPRFLGLFRKKTQTQNNCDWHLDELRDALCNAITRAQGPPIVMFVDALDECDENHARRIVEFFESAASSAASSFRRFLSSRHYPHIRLKKCLEIHLEPETEADIEAYVHMKLGTRPADEQSSELATKILRKASGVFLWVVLVVDKLLKAQDDGEPKGRMHNILSSVPAQLDELFAQNLRTLIGTDRKEALLMMHWVLFSEEPLGWRQLHSVLYPDADASRFSRQSSRVAEYERTERLIRSRSRGLLEFNPFSKDFYAGTKTVVQFIHESVRDFVLLSKGLQILDSTIEENPISMSQDQLTRSCIS